MAKREQRPLPLSLGGAGTGHRPAGAVGRAPHRRARPRRRGPARRATSDRGATRLGRCSPWRRRAGRATSRRWPTGSGAPNGPPAIGRPSTSTSAAPAGAGAARRRSLHRLARSRATRWTRATARSTPTWRSSCSNEARSVLANDPSGAQWFVDAALSLWRGTAYALDDEVVVPTAAHHLEALRRDAEELRVELLLLAGDARPPRRRRSRGRARAAAGTPVGPVAAGPVPRWSHGRSAGHLPGRPRRADRGARASSRDPSSAISRQPPSPTTWPGCASPWRRGTSLARSRRPLGRASDGRRNCIGRR